MIRFFQALTTDIAIPVVDPVIVVNSTNTTVDNKQVIAELGQSNMQGRDGDINNPSYPFTQDNAFWFKQDLTEVSLDTLRGGAIDGSHANYFGERYNNISGYKPVMSTTAVGGSGLTVVSGGSNNWSASGTLRGAAIGRVNDALTNYGLTSPLAALWSQGERDAQEMDSNVNYTKADAKAGMQSVIDWWFTNYPNSVFLISETGDFDPATNTQGWQDVRAIQREIASENERVYIAFDRAKFFSSEGKMVDNLHYNFTGYNEMGVGFANFLDGLIIK